MSDTPGYYDIPKTLDVIGRLVKEKEGVKCVLVIVYSEDEDEGEVEMHGLGEMTDNLEAVYDLLAEASFQIEELMNREVEE